MDIKLQQVSYAYSAGTPFEKYALFDVEIWIFHLKPIMQLLDIQVLVNQRFFNISMDY